MPGPLPVPDARSPDDWKDGPWLDKYTHLKKTFVKKGQKVIRSQAIALQGRSGNAHGDHLHFEIHIAGKHVNPYDFIGHNYECFKR